MINTKEIRDSVKYGEELPSAQLLALIIGLLCDEIDKLRARDAKCRCQPPRPPPWFERFFGRER